MGKTIRGLFILENLTKEKVDLALTLHANTLFVGYQNINPELADYTKAEGLTLNIELGMFVGEDMWRTYPESRPIDKHGRLMKKKHWYAGVCPCNQNVIDERFRLLDAILTTLKPNGIWLDFIRFPAYWEDIRSSSIREYCYCENCLARYASYKSTECEMTTWHEWKCAHITSLVETARDQCPNGNIGIFTIPWMPHDYGNAITEVTGQDVAQLSQYADYISPMTYHRFTGNKPSWIRDVITSVAQAGSKSILPLVQTEDRAGKISREEFRESLTIALKSDMSAGVIIFFLEDLMKDSKKVDALASIWS